MTLLGALGTLFILGAPASSNGLQWSPKSPIDSCFRGLTCSRGPLPVHLGPHLPPRAPLSSNMLFFLDLGALLVLGALGAYACPRGEWAREPGSHLASWGPMVFKEAHLLLI